MEHKIMVDGTAYAVKQGLAVVDGTVYEVKTGRTMTEGTVREVILSRPVTVTVTADVSNQLTNGTRIEINGEAYNKVGTWVFDRIETIVVENKAFISQNVFHNDVNVSNPYTFVPQGEEVAIHVKKTGSGHWVMITTS